jgi:hypothetical protein
MEDLEKIWEKMEAYAKETLGEEEGKAFMDKTILRGYTEGKESSSDWAWNNLVKPNKQEEYAHLNQLAYALNPQKVRNKTIIIPNRSVVEVYYKKKENGAEVEKTFVPSSENFVNGAANNDAEKEFGAFPREHTWKTGTVFKLPNMNKKVTAPILAKFIWGTFPEAKYSDGSRKKTLIGTVDQRTRWFHLMYSQSLQRIFNPLTRDGVLKTFEKRVDESLTNPNDRDVWIEPVEFKKNIARAVALAERVPFTALYAPIALLAQKIYRDAIDRGMEATGHKDFYAIDWKRPENMQVGEKKWANMPYAEGIVNSKTLSFAKEGSIIFDKFMREEGIKGEIKEENIKEELEQARKDVEEAFTRQTPEEYVGGEQQEHYSPFDDFEEEAQEVQTKETEKVEKVEEVEEDNTLLNGEDFPF